MTRRSWKVELGARLRVNGSAQDEVRRAVLRAFATGAPLGSRHLWEHRVELPMASDFDGHRLELVSSCSRCGLEVLLRADVERQDMLDPTARRNLLKVLLKKGDDVEEDQPEPNPVRRDKGTDDVHEPKE